MDPITPLTPAEAKQAEQDTAHESYVRKDLIAVDICANELLGGQMDETISSRMARWDVEDTGVKHEVGKLISKGLDLFQKDHGSQAVAGDLERAKEVEKVEESSGLAPE
jgi:hypothetical protein